MAIDIFQFIFKIMIAITVVLAVILLAMTTTAAVLPGSYYSFIFNGFFVGPYFYYKLYCIYLSINVHHKMAY
jgi:predicted membrane protein